MIHGTCPSATLTPKDTTRYEQQNRELSLKAGIESLPSQSGFKDTMAPKTPYPSWLIVDYQNRGLNAISMTSDRHIAEGNLRKVLNEAKTSFPSILHENTKKSNPLPPSLFIYAKYSNPTLTCQLKPCLSLQRPKNSVEFCVFAGLFSATNFSLAPRDPPTYHCLNTFPNIIKTMLYR
jgi:hypothetical protein